MGEEGTGAIKHRAGFATVSAFDSVTVRSSLGFLACTWSWLFAEQNGISNLLITT